MAGQSDLDQFDIDIRRDGDSVVAAIPQIGLFSRGDSEAAALAALEAKKRLLEADFAAFRKLDSGTNLEPEFPQPSRAAPIGWQSDIRSFAIKAGIVFLLIVVGAMFATMQMQQVIGSTLQQFEIRGGKAFWSVVERELARAADPANALPPEKKQQLLAQIRAVVDAWRPFVTETTAIFVPEETPGAVGTGSEGVAAPDVTGTTATSGGGTTTAP